MFAPSQLGALSAFLTLPRPAASRIPGLRVSVTTGHRSISQVMVDGDHDPRSAAPGGDGHHDWDLVHARRSH